ncbi:Hypothetical predicted protein [Octopus vulgaris]|uniref:Uncharacterized protein n=1 Tax=Octopus vulgaris TaxID=6645 RepID=A0AA36F3G3_OCTVU|nr:Hypothetical predicted protein [Octopus vulgaris]
MAQDKGENNFFIVALSKNTSIGNCDPRRLYIITAVTVISLAVTGGGLGVCDGDDVDRVGDADEWRAGDMG